MEIRFQEVITKMKKYYIALLLLIKANGIINNILKHLSISLIDAVE